MLTNLIKFQSRCPVDQSIFPGFTPDANALQSIYEAFRFTESYGVIFQCNVKYCLGPCEPAVCEWGRDSMESWGRKRRSVGNETSSDEDMNISQEILVLDFGDENNKDFLRSPDPSTEFGRGEISFEFILLINANCFFPQIKLSQLSSHVPQKPQYLLSESHVH